jgi:hypothetical protein
MPETMASFSGGTCSSRQMRCTAESMAKSPQLGHQRATPPS